MCLGNQDVEFSFNVEVDNGKKKLTNMPYGWQKLTKSIINKDHNSIGILTGKINNKTIIDFDSKEVWDKYKHFCKDTFIEQSYSGMWHAYFLYDSELQATNIEKIDIINEGKNKMCIKGKPINNLPIINIPIEFKKILMETNKKSNESIKSNKFENLDKIKELVNILTEEESNDRDAWLKIGFSIKNILEDKEEAKDIYSAFSRLSKKYNVKEFNAHWKTIKTDSSNSILSIIHYTKNYKKQMKVWNKKWNNDENIVININKLNIFNYYDNYNFYTFKDHLFHTIYDNKNDLIEYINENLYKVCARVGDKMIIKMPLDEFNNINSIESFNDKWRCENKCKYKGLDSFGSSKLFIKPLKDFIEEYPNLINSFNKINTDFIFKDTIINDNEFYVSQPFPTTYINIENRDNNILDLWISYIKEVICDNDEICFNHLNKWFSFIINNPNFKSGIAVALIGLQGCGKSRLVDFLSNFIFGNYNSKPNLAGFDELFGNFNSEFLGKKFICVNEMASSKDSYRSNFDKMKTLITENKMVIHQKFQTPFDAKQNLEFILCSNNLNSLNIEKSDRRYFILEVSDKYKKNSDLSRDDKHNEMCFNYWISFEKNIMNQDSANIIYSYYKDMNIGKEFIGEIIPNTKLKNELKILSKQTPELYVDYLRECECLNEIIYENKLVSGTYRYKTTAIYTNYREWCELNGERTIYSKTKFHSYLTNNLNIQYIRATGSWYVF
jgi:hypothetical protein